MAKRSEFTSAAVAGVTANVILGASSIYWKQLGAILPTTLLGYRILLSLATLTLVMFMLGKLSGLRGKLSSKTFAIHALAGCLVVVNWGTFIWASVHGHVIESGLGYLIAPFIAIGVAALLLGDSISKTRLVALAVIAATVIVLLLRSGELSHWVYLVIGATWGGYACLKKLTPLDAFAGLLVETMVLAVIWAVLLVATPITLVLPADIPLISITLLLLCGAVSVVPLWLFAHAATRLPLSVMGFFQFVLPITQLVVALTFYKQPMSVNTLVGFLVILAALLVTVAEPLWRRQGREAVELRSAKS